MKFIAKKAVLQTAVIVIAVVVLNSCIGASADISIRADGSGRIALEYRISKALESLGRQDGSERRPIIPAGKEDFERGLARVSGLTLRSFSSKEVRSTNDGRDILIKAVLDFTDPGALLSFLDITGSHASLVQNNTEPANLLRLVLLEPSADVLNADLVSLLREVYAGYEIRISLSVPKSASLEVSPPSAAARTVSGGKKVSFAIEIGELLTLTEGLVLEINW